VVGQALEDVGAVADIEADLEIGIPLAEALDERRQQELTGGRHGADPQRPPSALRRLAGRAGALLEQTEHVGGVRRVCGARRRRPQSAPGALRQGDPELPLEGGDSGRDGRLRDDELLRRRSHGTAADDRQERHELSESHGHANCSKHIADPMVARQT
jgi:hypothetical protein